MNHPAITCRSIVREHGKAMLKTADDLKFDPGTAAKQMRQTANLIDAEIIDARAASMANRKINAAGD